VEALKYNIIHKIQKQLIELSEKENINSLSLAEIQDKIGASNRQTIFYHLKQLKKKGLLN